MRASSLDSRLMKGIDARTWLLWQLPIRLRSYVIGVSSGAFIVIGWTAAHTEWRSLDVVKFVIFVFCGMVSVASTPRIMYRVGGGLTRDFSAVWVLPVAVLLPPLYAALAPIAFSFALNLFVHRGIFHRAVFSASAQGIAYAAASAAFRMFPATFAGADVGSGTHAFTWCVAVLTVELIGSRGHNFLILGAVKMSAPHLRVWSLELDRSALQALLVEMDLGVLITLAVALSPSLVLIGLPTVLLIRRFLVFPILEAQVRVDAKTGLLNVSTWEREGEAEISRAVRTRNPVALALVDIDNFKRVNDTYGHLVGDRVLKAIAEALTSQSRDYDRAGRFGGEEFVLLLVQTSADDACKIAERLRSYVASLAIPMDDRPDAPTVTVTISIGVTAMARGETYELTDLLAAADSAMYAAKQAGRNQVAYAPPLRDMGLDADWASNAGSHSPANGRRRNASHHAGTPLASSPLTSHQVVLVQTDSTGASLCPRM